MTPKINLILLTTYCLIIYVYIFFYLFNCVKDYYTLPSATASKESILIHLSATMLLSIC